MKPLPDFPHFMSLLEAGNRQALQEAYTRFGPLLRIAVRRRMHPELRARFDTLDFVQDVWASFLRTPFDGERFASSEALVAFLCQVARNKVTDVVRRRLESEKDSAKREDHDPIAINGLHTRSPSPSQWLMATEEFETILRQFPLGHQAIIVRLREGYTNEDIAALSNVSLSTVNRVIRRLKELTEG